MELSRRKELIAFLGALTLFLATVEYLFPKPVPFMRIGLANLPLLLALGILNFRELMLLTLLKVLGQGVINGTLASYVFIFSLVGSYGSVLVMWISYSLAGPWFSLVGLSLLGALTSNVIQMLFSVTFIFGPSAWVMAPLFMTIGLGGGLVIGLFAETFSSRSLWLEQLKREIL